ncbi:MAG: ABC transporter permease [Hyphomicrobiaceae bacterium]
MAETNTQATRREPDVELVKTYWRSVGERLLRDRVTVGVALILAVMVSASLLAPWLAPHDPMAGSVANRLKPVGTTGHLLGTDETGRDMLSRILYGGRLSLLCGLTPVILATLIGGFIGVIAGVAGGVVNALLMRLMDVLYAFPSVLLAVAICGVLGAGITNTILSLTIVFVPPIVRITESLTTQVRNLDFVEAARAAGASHLELIRFQVIANILGPLFVYATSLVSISIILASGLSFLGLGVVPPAAEWGLMLNALRQAIWVDPVLAALPGVAILVTSMCFNLLSDGLRTAMDTRLKA